MRGPERQVKRRVFDAWPWGWKGRRWQDVMPLEAWYWSALVGGGGGGGDSDSGSLSSLPPSLPPSPETSYEFKGAEPYEGVLRGEPWGRGSKTRRERVLDEIDKKKGRKIEDKQFPKGRYRVKEYRRSEGGILEGRRGGVIGRFKRENGDQ